MDIGITIAAVSTPLGTGGIGIIRISGPAAFLVAGKIFRANNGKIPADMSGYTSALGRVYASDQPIDDAVIQIFRAPKSYTGEDVAEISCHGGTWIMRRVLRLCLENGAVAASPGEFTKRAFLNGKLNLTQAEAVASMIAAHGESSMKAAISARDGSISKQVDMVTRKLVGQSASLAAWADFPDEDLEQLGGTDIMRDLDEASADILRLLKTYDTGRILRDGISVAIVGKPNVGKSTLMNLLMGNERSIVTEIAGTTRDVIEDNAMLGDFLLKIADTAGIRQTSDIVEAAGVARSREKIDTSELIFAVFDSSDELRNEDLELLALLESKPCIAVINKIDLPQKLDVDRIMSSIPRVVHLSAKNGADLKGLADAATELLGISGFDPTAAIIQSERQRLCLQTALDSVVEAKTALSDNMLDAVNVCIDYAIDELLTLTGERASDRVVDEVFSRFCVGK